MRCSLPPTSMSTSFGSHLPRCASSVDNVFVSVRTLLGYETRGLRWITFSREGLFRFALSDFFIVASFRVLGCGDLDLSRFRRVARRT